MQAAASRRSSTRTNGVVAGSVWETRMKLDQVKGGIKVFNADDTHDDEAGAGDDEAGLRVYNLRLRRSQNDGAAEKRKRKNWSSPEAGAVAVGGGGGDKTPPARLRKTQSSSASNSPKISDKTLVEAGEEKTAVTRSLSSAAAFGGGGGVQQMEDCTEEQDRGGGDVEEMEVEKGRGCFDDKEVDMPGEKKTPGNAEGEEADKEISQIRDIPISSDADEKTPEAMEEHPAVDADVVSSPPKTAAIPDSEKPTPKVIDLEPTSPPRRVVHPFVTKPAPVADEEFYENIPETQHPRMQSIVDLVMWTDISRSAFVFGIGSFLLLSSSYAKDLNFSFVSAISYLGLVYLATIFLYKSIILRGARDWEETEQGCVVGEEEAIWLARLLLPYINEVLLKLKALFSGDPATTMKLALMLFVLARCGGSITVWTMAKLGFFGVFTVPKICSSYSVQLARYGKFWLERVRDAWESCQHKKAVAAAVFTLIWNLSSTAARVWAVFMLVVAVRFYQQRVAAGDEVAEEDVWDGQEEAEPPPQQQQQLVQQRHQRWQAAAEDSKQRAGGGVGRGRVAAGGGQAAAQLLGLGRGHRQAAGPSPTKVVGGLVAREKKKWS